MPTTPLSPTGVIQGTLRLGITDGAGNPLCLDDDNNTSPGTAAIVWPCGATNPNQQWTLNPDGSVRSTASGLCLDVFGGATTSGTPLDQWPCTGNSNQRWIR